MPILVPKGSLLTPGGAQGPPGSGGGGATVTSTTYDEVGSIKGWPTSTPPIDWMECDGRELICNDYPDLYAVLGTTYGGTALEVFNLPNFRGRVLVGLSGVGASMYLGQTGGEETHVLSIAEMPIHTHIQDTHQHVTGCIAKYVADGGTLVYSVQDNTNSNAPNQWGTTRTVATNQNTGGGVAHNNMPPYLVGIYIIKVKKSVGTTEPIPIADATQDGLMRKVSGLTTDYVGGDNQCHPLPISVELDYSLEEQDTGKKWIDGKKIYQKTIKCPTLVAGITDYPHGITNLSSIINYQLMTSDGNDFVQSTYAYGIERLCVFVSSRTTLVFMVEGAWINYTENYCTMQYTCTDR